MVKNVRAFILCAGSGSRWGEYLGGPKQLISFNGETLLSRIIRQLQKNNIFDIHVVCNDSRLSSHEAVSIQPIHCGLLVDTILSTSAYWTDCNIMILGDVFFTDMAMSKICGCPKSFVFFGRPWASKLISCDHGELFAFRFNKDSVDLIKNSINNILDTGNEELRGNLWDLYHNLAGIPYNSGVATRRMFVIIDDITNDFDSPLDFEKRRMIYEQITSKSVAEKSLLLFSFLCRLPFHLINRKPVAIGDLKKLAGSRK